MTHTVTQASDYTFIGFSGKAGAGKDYFVNNFYLPWWRLNTYGKKPALKLCFADQIKINGLLHHDLDPEKVFGQRDQRTRSLLQRVGTEEGRNIFGTDIWLRHLDAWALLQHHNNLIQHFVVCDVRFRDEMDFIRSKGGLIVEVSAPDRHKDRQITEGWTREQIKHQSENDLRFATFDYVIHNDYNDDIKPQLPAFYHYIQSKYLAD